MMLLLLVLSDSSGNLLSESGFTFKLIKTHYNNYFTCSSGSTCLLEVVIHANHILLKASSQDKNDVTDEMVLFSFL